MQCDVIKRHGQDSSVRPRYSSPAHTRHWRVPRSRALPHQVSPDSFSFCHHRYRSHLSSITFLLHFSHSTNPSFFLLHHIESLRSRSRKSTSASLNTFQTSSPRSSTEVRTHPTYLNFARSVLTCHDIHLFTCS
jgi:hypothetical protein